MVVAALMLLGAAAVLVAGVGIVRMPDLFTRMQATSKAATLGAILVLLATALAFAELGIVVRSAVVVIFLALTAPIGAHMLARAGYLAGARMCDPDAVDELEGRYSPDGERLDGPAASETP